ncbi:sigma-54 dependent transcriptional regulator [Pseudovibrio exalbescens]|uniref:sigma-54-dependent transcriptional regulator n=1 Tax=Pseudovibrio exalbescens TaxID=197461 RepID=UPI002365B2B1|nr:sigma-54 dependent transcriptional regulator [Pseudovibrio exalbescens]MDD7911351.1 sigma-54 dependent transcriptional regulator [Pseudovibrio exalbescens]
MGSYTSGMHGFSACVLDQNLASAAQTAKLLQGTGFIDETPLLFQEGNALIDQLSVAAVDVVLVDLEKLGGEEALVDITMACPEAILLAMSSKGSVSRALGSMSAGAHDFIIKPFSQKALSDKLEAHLSTRRRRKSAPAKRPAPPVSKVPQVSECRFERFVGSCDTMKAVYDQITKMAGSSAPVFITGESGTGKELAAQALHNRSPRSSKPFIAINCAAIPHELMESEIFGHVRGAFTGATENRQGAAELADGGTLFLDEIGELDLKLQTKLLRFLQTGTYQRVGETSLRKVDVRIICATNRNPLVEVHEGRFREDLFYRLHVLPIHLPPLRERQDDVIELAKTFLLRSAGEENKRFQGFTADAEALMRAYNWPGNVRELENTIRQITVMHDSLAVTADMLPAHLRPAEKVGFTPLDDPLDMRKTISERFSSVEPLWSQEKRIIENALAVFEGNIAQAAAALEISPSTIYRKKQSWAERQAC